MADAEAEAPPPPAEGEAAPATSKLAKWRRATKLQVNAMRATGAKAVPGGLAFGGAEGGEGAALAEGVGEKKTAGLWKKSLKYVKTATVFGSKPETAEPVPEDFSLNPKPAAPSAAASKWAKAKKGVAMVRALGGQKETKYEPTPPPSVKHPTPPPSVKDATPPPSVKHPTPPPSVKDPSPPQRPPPPP